MTSRRVTISEPLWVFKHALDDLRAHDTFVIVVKGQCACQERIENDAERPNIDLWLKMQLEQNDLYSKG